jgi:hypothetical protein
MCVVTNFFSSFVQTIMADTCSSKTYLRNCILFRFHAKNNAIKTAKKHLRQLWRRVRSKKMPTLVKKIISGNLSLENDPRRGRPYTVYKAVLKAEIEKNPTLTIKEL